MGAFIENGELLNSGLLYISQPKFGYLSLKFWLDGIEK